MRAPTRYECRGHFLSVRSAYSLELMQQKRAFLKLCIVWLTYLFPKDFMHLVHALILAPASKPNFVMGKVSHCKLGFWCCFTVGLYFPLSFECLIMGLLCFPHIAHACAIGHSVAELFFFCNTCGTMYIWSLSSLSLYLYSRLCSTRFPTEWLRIPLGILLPRMQGV